MKQGIAAVMALLMLAGCGGGSSSGPSQPPNPPPPPPPDDVDSLGLAASPQWSSATNGIRVATDYGLNTDTETAVTNRAIRADDLGGLRDSRIAFYQDTGQLLADDYGDSFLDITVSSGGETVDLGGATRALSNGCDLELAQSLNIAGNAAQGTLRWVHRESVTFTDNGGSPTCGETLDAVAADLFNATAPDFPFDLVTLIRLQAVDSMQLNDLNGWTLDHIQSVAKYYRLIGDAGYELAPPDQRIAMEVFAAAADRADALVDQLIP